MKTSIEQVLGWLWLHAPGMVVFLVIIIAVAWIAIKVNDFIKRVSVNEERLTVGEKTSAETQKLQIDFIGFGTRLAATEQLNGSC